MELYMESHAVITSFNKYCKRIVTMKEALEFTNLLQKRLDIHGNVINKLSQGFRLGFKFFDFYKVQIVNLTTSSLTTVAMTQTKRTS